METFPRMLTMASAVGAGLAAGVFLAFSVIVMPALERVSRIQGLTVMQAINKTAPNAWFMTVLFGTAAMCVGLLISAVRRLDESVAIYQLVGCAAYLVAIIVTIVYHVPRNDALGLVNPADPGAGDSWTAYLPGWEAWNHVRTLTCLASAVAFTLALRAD